MSDKNPLDDASVLAQLANKKSKGTRPSYFGDQMAEQHYSITMALVAELAVARERIDTLERVLSEAGLLDRNKIESYVPDDNAAEERQRAQVEYSARIFRAMQQQVEAMQQKELSVEEMAKRLAETDQESDTNEPE